MARMHMTVLLFCMCVTARGQGDAKGKVKDNDLSLWLYSKEKPQMIQNEGLNVQLSFAFGCHGCPNNELACLAKAVSRSSFNVTSLLFKKLLSKGQKNKCWWGCGKKANTWVSFTELYVSVTIMRIDLTHLKGRIPMWSSNLALAFTPKGNEISMIRKHRYSHSQGNRTGYLRRRVNLCVIDVWLDKENTLYM